MLAREKVLAAQSEVKRMGDTKLGCSAVTQVELPGTLCLGILGEEPGAEDLVVCTLNLNLKFQASIIPSYC